jgi:predicted RNA binding protein YcfA (HicA-like mRNA interferase family)
MKITTFDPMIVTSKAEDAISLFEALGFEKTHQPTTTTETGDVTSTRLKDASGFHVDVADVPDMTQDVMLIRMNVDNFDEAYEILKKHGFTNTRGDGSIQTTSAKAATMVSPSGFRISLIEHFKK